MTRFRFVPCPGCLERRDLPSVPLPLVGSGPVSGVERVVPPSGPIDPNDLLILVDPAPPAPKGPVGGFTPPGDPVV